ncbi:hypothetical protein TIFTF001_038375 [Ficus carica]|uniref:Uncharacterized protein n=1 Tax=Ficus carica TaxID=3494 RepID=A0AA88E788_FICCA|nr:hypothetical protein TIFTF001_038375 [Ficus carica]
MKKSDHRHHKGIKEEQTHKYRANQGSTMAKSDHRQHKDIKAAQSHKYSAHQGSTMAKSDYMQHKGIKAAQTHVHSAHQGSTMHKGINVAQTHVYNANQGSTMVKSDHRQIKGINVAQTHGNNAHQGSTMAKSDNKQHKGINVAQTNKYIPHQGSTMAKTHNRQHNGINVAQTHVHNANQVRFRGRIYTRVTELEPEDEYPVEGVGFGHELTGRRNDFRNSKYWVIRTPARLLLPSLTRRLICLKGTGRRQTLIDISEGKRGRRTTNRSYPWVADGRWDGCTAHRAPDSSTWAPELRRKRIGQRGQARRRQRKQGRFEKQ